MEIIPAIDLREGACAPVLGFEVNHEHFSPDPVEQSIMLKEQGAEWLHITDLDGAFSGHLCNLRVLQEIKEASGLKIQHSGGVRSMEDINTLAALGIERIVLSASVLRNRALTERAFATYGEKIVPGVDGRDGMVALEGFETAVATSVFKLLDEIKAMGVTRILFTDRRRCGAMKGPNFEGIRDILHISGLKVMIAGGINSYETIERLKEMGAGSLVIGKALYINAINLKRAQEIARR